MIVDGSSPDAVPKKMDLLVEGAHIKDIGNFSHVNAGRTIKADGLVVCPGFIDAHGHSEFTLLADGRAEGKISQGITTEVNGNCGMSAAPLAGPAREHREGELEALNIKDRWRTFSEFFVLLEQSKIATNFITLVGQGNLRASVAGYENKPLSASDRHRMTDLLKSSMEDGGKGLSTGLIYPPGVYSDTDEIIALAGEAVKYGGIYTTHMRSEGDTLLESVEEVIHIAAKTGISVHISHLKTSGKKNWGKRDALFEMIANAHDRGISITCDRYPYIASSTDLDTVLPSWAFEGGRDKEIERLRNERVKLAEEISVHYSGPSDWQNVVVSSVVSNKNKWMEGKSIREISGAQNKPEIDSVCDLLIDESLRVGAIFFTMSEDNLRSILQREYCVIGTDSAARSFDGITANGVPHPRGFGTFPRILGRYVRDLGVLTLSEAVYKMTGLPAHIFGIKKRGILAKGFFADIAVFDPGKVNDPADYSEPFRKPEGIHHVFNNGTPVLLNEGLTGALPGMILR